MTAGRWRAAAPWLGAVLGLCAVTAWFFGLAPLYRPAGPDLLVNGGFAEGVAGWRLDGPAAAVTAEPGRLVLENADADRQIGLTQTVAVPADGRLLRFGGRVAANGIASGPKHWHAARVYLVPHGPDGAPIWGRLSVLAAHRDAAAWRSHEAVVALPDGVSTVTVGVQMAWTAGRLAVGDLVLEPVAPRAFVPPVRLALAGLWAALLGAAGWRLGRAVPSRRRRALLLAAVGLVLAGVLMPLGAKTVLLALLLGLPDPQTGAAPDGPGGVLARIPLEALGHFLLFAVVAAVVRLTGVAGGTAVQGVGLALLAVATEVLQFFVAGRSPALGDWLVDLAGIAAGLALAAAVRFSRARPRAARRAAGTAPSRRRRPASRPTRPATGRAGR